MCVSGETATFTQTGAGTIAQNNAGHHGGGVCVWSGSVTLLGGQITDNTAEDGGGLFVAGGSATLSGVQIVDNHALIAGGGVHARGDSVTLSGNIVLSNTANKDGGGLYLRDSVVTMTNTIIADNWIELPTWHGSGLYVQDGTLDARHNTIACNSGGDGSGVHITGTIGIVALTNTILVSHTVGITVATGNTATLEATLWHGNGVNVGGEGLVISSTNVYGDSVFRASEIGDYHISLGSVAIDAGVDARVTNDIDGDTRPSGLGYDIGADEYFSRAYLPIVLKDHRTWDAYYEDNDQCLAAYGPLVSSQTYRAYPDDANDYYYFELSAPATVNVSVTDFAPTSTWGDLLLYGPTTGDECGGLIGQWGKPGYSAMSLGPYLLGAGKYHVRIYTAKNHSITQLYSLIVTY